MLIGNTLTVMDQLLPSKLRFTFVSLPRRDGDNAFMLLGPNSTIAWNQHCYLRVLYRLYPSVSINYGQIRTHIAQWVCSAFHSSSASEKSTPT